MSGSPAALEAMLDGESDIAVGVGEFPMVGKALQQTQARVIADMDRSQFISVVARADRGIAEVADLKGKRVGTTRGTIAEFFLARFLELHGLSVRDVTLIELKTPAEWVDAVVEGEVDAVATAEPYASSARERLGANATVWSAHSGQPVFALVIATDEWLTTHSDVAQRFLRALAQAEEYAARNPAEAQAIVQDALDLDPASMQAVWERNLFSLTLDQALIAAMEDEARWLIANNLTAERSVPDFLDYIWEAGLGEVRPEAVDLIRSSAP
jgi:NitT/TauT family transport system substrate-binding protein